MTPAAVASTMPVRKARSLAVFMGAMTVLWSIFGLRPYPAVSAIGVIVGVAVAVAAVAAARRMSAESVAAPTAVSATDRSVFRLAVAFEVVTAIVAIVALSKSGHPRYIMPVVALIVALHFFVFLVTQRSALHIATGIIGTVGAAAAIALMAAGAVGAAAGHAIAAVALSACTAAYGVTFVRLILSVNESGPA